MNKKKLLAFLVYSQSNSSNFKGLFKSQNALDDLEAILSSFYKELQENPLRNEGTPSRFKRAEPEFNGEPAYQELKLLSFGRLGRNIEILRLAIRIFNQFFQKEEWLSYEKAKEAFDRLKKLLLGFWGEFESVVFQDYQSMKGLEIQNGECCLKRLIEKAKKASEMMAEGNPAKRSRKRNKSHEKSISYQMGQLASQLIKGKIALAKIKLVEIQINEELAPFLNSKTQEEI